MNSYEKLSTKNLIDFYNEITKNIEKEILTKNMYYELGLIIAVANRRGFTLNRPHDFKEVVNQQALDNLNQSEQVII